ncbi:High affinity cAMP-specific 3',5'-cyclic phosphodiesterase 7A [Borealophlyctis nickersoniae]|nr:High affinity cAMP-specific 3',5'-cyclic phosphodiesterase 7A [Borealophlyctis nickersoniae]
MIPGHARGATTGASEAGDNTSILSKTTRLRLKDLGHHPLRGPIMAQMVTHYCSFLVLLWVAFQTEWSPAIRFYMAYFYFNICVFILECSRMAFAADPNSVVPFYISVFPFALIIFISREAHMIVMVLWYVSFLIIYLQSGHHDMSKHLMFYSIAFVLVYVGCVVGMHFFYIENCSTEFCGVGLRGGIQPVYEAVLVGGCLMVVGCFMMLERFIKLNASTLLERENYMQQLFNANIDLKKQLRRAKNDKEVDLEAPLARATQILKEVKDTQELDRAVQGEIDFIIGILGSDQLYNPNLYQKPGDADVHDWLNDMLLTQKDSRASGTGKSGSANGSKANSKASSFRVDGSEPSSIVGVNAIPPAPGTAPASGSGVVTGPAVIAGLAAIEKASGLGAAEAGPSMAAAPLASPTADLSLAQSDLDILSSIDAQLTNPNFDMFDFSKSCNGRELYYTGYQIFRSHDFFATHNIPEHKFRNWLSKIEEGYISGNPYHNATHAADVTFTMHYFITRPRLWNVLDPFEQLATVIAPIIHDYMHPGVNNAFLIATLNPLAIRYNDQAVLENFHCASVFELMQQEDYDFLGNIPPESRKVIRECVISMVMATDMSHHFDWIGKFKTKMAGAGLNFENRVERKLVMNIAIKCADVNNPTKPLDTCRRWTDLIMEEFFAQGEAEKKKGVPVSPMMDRAATDIPKCQIGFIDFIVYPLFEAWAGFMQEDLDAHMQNIQNNKSYWKSRVDAAAPPPAPIAPAPSVGGGAGGMESRTGTGTGSGIINLGSGVLGAGESTARLSTKGRDGVGGSRAGLVLASVRDGEGRSSVSKSVKGSIGKSGHQPANSSRGSLVQQSHDHLVRGSSAPIGQPHEGGSSASPHPLRGLKDWQEDPPRSPGAISLPPLRGVRGIGPVNGGDESRSTSGRNIVESGKDDDNARAEDR